MAGRLLGYRRATTTNRYAHLDDATLREVAERVMLTTKLNLCSVNGGGNMYRGGGAKMYHGLGGSLSA